MLRMTCLIACSVLVVLVTWVEVRAESADGRTTVVWISIDGVRHDYVERAQTPTIDRLASEGAFSRAMVPVFPSLTFPNHVSQVTGVPPARHGVTSNTFYDSRRRREYRFPPWSNMLEAEPIWQTATRQGLRVAVQDWPMGHDQKGPHAAAYFTDKFDTGLSDRVRLERLLDVWENDHDEQPLQLLIGWIGTPDSVGHKHGPESEEVVAAMQETDELLGWFIERAQALWQRTAAEGDQLYFLFTTDHGMSDVHSLVHLRKLVGLEDIDDEVTDVTSGNIGNIHVDQVAGATRREAIVASILQAAESHDFVRAYRREDLPSRWNYAHRHRTGDVVLVLDTGYTFSGRPEQPVEPVSEHDGPLGMHGYDPALDENMLGYSVVWRWPEPLGGVDLEQIHVLQFHPTVAALLGIEPAAGATAEPIALPAVEPVPAGR